MDVARRRTPLVPARPETLTRAGSVSATLVSTLVSPGYRPDARKRPTGRGCGALGDRSRARRRAGE
jgi:hypothetical protein